MSSSVANTSTDDQSNNISKGTRQLQQSKPKPIHRSLKKATKNKRSNPDPPEETTFVITSTENDSSPTTPFRVEIEIINPKSPHQYWYSVTFASYNQYTGTAINIGEWDNGRPNKSLLYYWKPLFDGEYEVIVHELPIFIRGNDPPTLPLMNPYPVVIVSSKPGVSSWALVQERIASLLPCQQTHKIGLYANWEGDWIGPDRINVATPHIPTPETSLRTGWYFLPSPDMNCKIEVFNNEELARLPELKSIYIIGTSKERGVFLSLVDMILDLQEKEALEESVISKCWGRAFVEKFNLKVLYQDWRSNFFEPLDAQPNVICHDDKVVREGGSTFVNNGLKVWQEIFQHQASWPSVILMSVTGDPVFHGEYDLQRFISSLPPTWEGTLFLTDGTFSARDAGRGTASNHREYREKLLNLTNSMFDRRVQWLDGMGISKEMRMYAEEGPNFTTKSQHFHGHCNQPYYNHLESDQEGQPTDKRMLICSNITEMVAQLMLNHAIGPKQHFLEKVHQMEFKQDTTTSQMTYCHACPEEMLPFHITPYPDMTCAKGALHSRTKNEIKKRTVPQTCPVDCLELEIQRFVPTQSGVVHERTCPMSIFLPGLQNNNEMVQEVVPDSNKVYPMGLSFCSLILISLYFRGRIRLHVSKLVGFVQSHLSNREFKASSN